MTVVGTKGQNPFVPKASYQHPNLPGCSCWMVFHPAVPHITQDSIPARSLCHGLSLGVQALPHPLLTPPNLGTSSYAGQRPRRTPRKKSPQLKADPEAPTPKVSSFVALSGCPVPCALLGLLMNSW